MARTRTRSIVCLASAGAVVIALGVGTASPVLAAGGEAPGAPGKASNWVPGDKDGFGTARGTGSKVWYTLRNGELSEIYYPRIDTPSTRDTELIANDDTGRTQGGALAATDGRGSDALAASSGFQKTSSGYLGVSDGWTDLASDHRMNWAYHASEPGNVVQTGLTQLTGLAGGQRLTLAIGFAVTTSGAVARAHASLAAGFGTTRQRYSAGWHQYLAGLRPVPGPARPFATEYHVSQMVLAASEDKTFRGGFVAAPGRPWAWANVLQQFAVYHAVWSRDLYQIATALIAMGDRAAAGRALHYLFTVQEQPDGSYPQNSRLNGTPVFGGLQMDEVSFPTLLAWQLHRI